MKLAEKALDPRAVARATQIEIRRLQRRQAALERVVVVVKHLLDYPDKTLIPWTEWADLRMALAALNEVKGG